jgi:copper chaperone CopZ
MSVAEAGTGLDLEIEGMHCEACVRRVRQALVRAGVGESEVGIGHAHVEAPAEAAAGLVSALDKAGFAARVRS